MQYPRREQSGVTSMANEFSTSPQDPTASSEAAGAFTTLKSKAQEVGAKAAQRADQARVSAAAGMDTVASSLHERGDRMASAAHSAADAVSHGADYLRAHDVETMMGDLVDVIRRNPGLALLGAASLGFLLGRALSRD
jgi:ElaB/YqjD/DUF883 family membrane-anchored ribosome-binding protein